MQVQILTPHGSPFSADADSIRLETELGQIEILPQHDALIAALEIGLAEVRGGGDLTTFALNFGYVEVLDDGVRVVTESAERKEDIDVERARAARARALQRLEALDPVDDAERIARTEASLRRAEVRLRVAGC